MMFDLPESLVEKCRKVMEASQPAEPPKPEDPTPPTEDKKDEPKRKGEPVVFNPEIKPDVYTEPYKVQPTT
jgi:hypothetical protein